MDACNKPLHTKGETGIILPPVATNNFVASKKEDQNI